MSHRQARRKPGPSRAGFTLVEMLVVVAIIAILAAILVPAVYLGLTAAADAKIAMELANIDAAMKQYKTVTHGYAYPPNFTGNAYGGMTSWSTVPTVVVQHIQQKFGRLNLTTAQKPPDELDPAEALVFWLQGYGSNPTNPLAGERKKLFPFDESRLRDNGDGDNYLVYYPDGAQQIPYVYFHNGSYGNLTYHGSSATNELGVGGVAHPYKRDGGMEYVNPETYQIISAGQDGDWGADNANKQFSKNANGTYSDGDMDNITNFSEGTLEDQLE